MKPEALSRLAREAPEMAPYVDYVRRAAGSPTLAGRFVGSGGRQLLFEKALQDIDGAFRQAGIEFLVLKGMALGYLVYPDPATRPMTDIDLFVRPADVARAAALLQGQGFRPTEHQERFTEDLVRFGGELSFQRDPGPFLDLHWLLEQYERLRGVLRIDEEALWRRAMPYAIGDHRFRTPSPEDQVLTLAIHLGLVHRRCSEFLIMTSKVLTAFWPVKVRI